MNAKTKWIRVTRDRPCPVCKKPDWCGISEDGTAVTCMRVESAKVVANGGWLHKLTAGPLPPIVTKPKPERLVAASIPDEMKRIQAQTTADDVDTYAVELGVSRESLGALGAARGAKAWAYPMKDANESVIGIRYRSANGKKWAETGSRNGLFIPWYQDPPQDGVAYVCEGPTDTAAALTLGLWTVGRSQCRGNVEDLRQYLRKNSIRRVVIIADHDEAKTRPDGSVWYPGKEGAYALAKDLKMPAKVILPPAKDLRAWLREGATLAAVHMIESQLVWRNV